MVFSKLKKPLVLEIIFLILLLLSFYLAYTVNHLNRKDDWEFKDTDIEAEFNQALTIASGSNPYTKILQYNLLTNNKYATLLPLYYYYLAGVASTTGNEFTRFIDAFRDQLYVAELITGITIYLIFRRSNNRALGVLAGSFFMLNRWIISNLRDIKQDVIAMMFLMIALYLLTSVNKKLKILSFLFLGLSIGIKHIGIFVSPVFLLPFITKELNLKDIIKGGILFLIPTVGIGLPVILNSPQAFFYSMLFSFTRAPVSRVSDFGYEKLLVLYDVGVKNNNVFFYMLPRLPLVLFSLANFILLIKRKIPIYLFCFASLFIFIAFNPVLFQQYFAWISPFVFLAGYDLIKRRPTEI